MVNTIDNCGFVLKTQYNTDKSGLEMKIPDTSGLVKKTHYDVKITEIEGKISSIHELATTTAFNAVENKISKVCDLVKQKTKKKTDYNAKRSDIESKYFTTFDYNIFNE